MFVKLLWWRRFQCFLWCRYTLYGSFLWRKQSLPILLQLLNHLRHCLNLAFLLLDILSQFSFQIPIHFRQSMNLRIQLINYLANLLFISAINISQLLRQDRSLNRSRL